jgi:capsular exopolysaccharide synthesis family protein
MSKQLWFARLNAAWRYKWILVLALIAGVVWGIQSVFSETPQYRATLTLLLEPEGYYAESTTGLSNFYSWKSVATQHALIQSRSLAERVVDDLNLVDRRPLLIIPERKFQGSLMNWAVALREHITGAAGDLLKPAEAPSQIPAGNVSDQQNDGRRDALAGMIRAGLSVKGDDRTELIYMSFDSHDPAFAQEVINETATEFIRQQEEVTLTKARRKSAWLTERIGELRLQLEESIKKLQSYRMSEGVGDTGSLVDRSNSRLDFLENNVTERKMELDALASRYGPKHPKIIAATQQLMEAQKFIATEQDKALGSRQKEFQLKELELDVSSNREMYELFLSHLRETDLSTTQSIRDVRIIDPAKLPLDPFSPNEARLIEKRIFWALALGLGLVGLIVFLDNKFRDPEQAEQILQIPAIGSLPLLHPKDYQASLRDVNNTEPGMKLKPEFYSASRPKSVFAEAVNSIQAGVVFSDPDNPPHVIVVSSSLEAEGKTTLATNLATAFSRVGKTLLIDADLRKPKLHKVSNTQHHAGLADLIIGTAPQDKCIVQDRFTQNLSLLSHGMIPPDPLELLNSVRFEQLLDELKKIYKHIVIDTSPILPVSDAIVLSHRANGLILVIQANKTTHWTARMAVKKLTKANVNVLGLVLSKMDSRRAYYYSNYRNYYESYYSVDSLEASKDNGSQRITHQGS